jgi:hypothetical protein
MDGAAIDELEHDVNVNVNPMATITAAALIVLLYRFTLAKPARTPEAFDCPNAARPSSQFDPLSKDDSLRRFG